jgi:ubiquitin-like protein Pup
VAERISKPKQSSPRTQETVADDVAASGQGEKIKAELDDLLDEIDNVLEDNAEEFVKSYVQKGGE